MAQAANWATPFTAVTGLVLQPLSVAPDVPVPVLIESVTLLAAVSTVLAKASWTVTCGWGENAEPAVGDTGTDVIESCEAAAALTVTF